MHTLLLDLVAHLLLVAVGALVVVTGAQTRHAPARLAFAATAIVALAGTVLTLLSVRTASYSLFGVMRAACWALFVHLPIWFAMIGALRRPPTRIVLWALAGALAAIGVDALVIEPHALQVTHSSFADARLSHPIRIAVIADIQMDSFGDYERHALAEAAAAKPDLVLFAGDYIQADDDATARAIAHDWQVEIRRLGLDTTRYGAFAVQGNSETGAGPRNPQGFARRPPPRDWAWWETDFGDTRVRAFPQTGTIVVDDIAVTGLTLEDSFTARAMPTPPPADSLFHVVLGHAPDFALGDWNGLLVAGHTHGGQVQLPGFGPLMTASHVPRAWAAGGIRLVGSDSVLYVSRGIGMERMEAPRLRFRCRPELAIIDAYPAFGPAHH
jgi:hypothetical protein